MHASRPADEDRLPWLEPYRDTKAPTKAPARGGHGGAAAIALGMALLIGVGAGGYWLGQRGEVPDRPHGSETVALPDPRPQQPTRVAEVPTTETAGTATETAVEAETAAAEPKPAPPARVAKPVRKKVAARKKPRPKKIRSAGIETDQLNAVSAAQEAKPVPPAQPVSPAWPKMPSPGPAGQVIQLGAFSTAARAGNAYQQRIARYPLLARMPRVIVPVVTKPGGRVLYVLRLGTTSRQQSNIVCRNLRRSGDHCLVIG